MEQNLCRYHRPLQMFTLERHKYNHKVMCLNGGYVTCGETKCRMCSKYVLWYIGLDKVLYGLVLEHHKSWIVSLDIF